MNLEKGFKAAKVPVIILVVLAALHAVLVSVIPPVGGVVLCLVGPVVFVISVLLYLWLGFLIYKANLEIVDAAVVGGLTGIITSLVGGIISLIASMLGLGVGMATGGMGMFDAAFGTGLRVVGIVLSVIIGFIVGLILGAIGYFIGKVLKK